MEGEGMPVKSEAADPAEEVSPAEKAKAEAERVKKLSDELKVKKEDADRRQRIREHEDKE